MFKYQKIGVGEFSKHSLRFILAAFLISVSLITSHPVGAAGTYTPPSSNRVDINLNSTWKFIRSDVSGAQSPSFNDSSWTSLSLPHTWNNLDGEDGGNNYYRGIGWYRKHYTINSAYAGRKFYLQFDGASLVTDVYINGTSLGEHQGAFATFRFDATPYVNVGADNVIAVKVNNALNLDVLPLAGDFTLFGGIYRTVHLLITDPLAVQVLDYGSSGVYLMPTKVSASSANLQITAKLSNSNSASRSVTLDSVIVDASNTIVQTLSSTQTIAANGTLNVVQTTTITNPHLWNARQDPYLYTVYVEVHSGSAVTDLVSQPLGFRYYNVDPNNGFFLNGRYLDLHGVDRHQDRLDKGWAISDADIDQDMGLINEIGANIIRTSHYQNAQHFYDLADQDGIVLWTEIPLINQITDDTAFTNNAKQQLTELIRQNYNHPAIMFWSLENELNTATDPLLPLLNTLAHTEDPTRLTGVAISSSTYWGTDVTDFNKYYGWYSGTLADFAPWADSAHSGNPTKDIGVTEYGAGSSINFHSLTPVERDHTEEYQNLFHETYWQAMKTRPFLWSKIIWNMFDFASDSRNEGDHAGRNDKGLVTYDRLTKKDAFYWYKANWTTTPVVYITSRRFTPRTSATTDIKVYANTSSVQLILNGKSLGSKTSTNDIFTWTNQTLQNGNNTVEAIGTQGSSTYTDTITWVLNGTGGTTTYDDSSSSFVYSSGWSHGNCNTNDHCYNGTNSWAHSTNNNVTLSFTGTQIKLYGLTETNNGFGAVSIDGGSETNVDFYAASRAGNILMWTSPTLAKGTHTFKLRVTGTHDSNSTGSIVVLDRVDVLP